MGIYIKGMEMQSRCTICVLCERWRYEGTRNLVCVPADRLIPEDCAERPDWCPMIEVPEPHGRLIDADAFFKDICDSLNQMTDIGIAVDGSWLWAKLYDAMENAPTIIEGSE